MTIAIFGDPLDPHVLAVEQALEAETRVTLFPPSLLVNGAEPFAELRTKGMHFRAAPKAAWLYRLPPPAVLPGPSFETLGASNAAVAMLFEWSERGTRLVNPLRRVLMQNKLIQLDAMRRARVPVPQTFVCFTHAQARMALSKLKSAIAKPVSQGWHTVLLTAANIDTLRLPCLVQSLAEGADVRVTVVGKKIVSAVEIPAAGEIDFRANPAYASGNVGYKPIELSPTERDIVLRAMRACELVFAGVDVKRKKKDQIRVLECNPGPAFLDIEHKLGHLVSRTLASYLLRK